MATTPRRYSRKTDSWEDGDTQWYSVNAWRTLAENCDRSLRRGDPVVVHGKLSAHVWTNKAGLEVTTFEVEAAFVGPRPQPRHQCLPARKLAAGSGAAGGGCRGRRLRPLPIAVDLGGRTRRVADHG